MDLGDLAIFFLAFGLDVFAQLDVPVSFGLLCGIEHVLTQHRLGSSGRNVYAEPAVDQSAGVMAGDARMTHIGILGAPIVGVVDSVLASFCMSSIREMLFRPPPPSDIDVSRARYQWWFRLTAFVQAIRTHHASSASLHTHTGTSIVAMTLCVGVRRALFRD